MRKFGWESTGLISIADGHVKLLYGAGDFGVVFLLYVFNPPFFNPIPTFLGGFESRLLMYDVQHCLYM